MAESQERTVENGGGTERRPESRSVTLADCLAMVAGFGFAFASRQNPPMPLPSMNIVIPVWVVVAWWSIEILLAMALATAVVVLVRQTTFRRPARPAEWVAILLGLLVFREALPNIDDLVNRWLPNWPDLTFGEGRWIICAIGTVVFLVGLAGLGLMRRALPHGLKTMILVASFLALMWGPSRVFALEGPWLLPSPAIELTSPPLFWAWLEIRKYLWFLPSGLLFGYPCDGGAQGLEGSRVQGTALDRMARARYRTGPHPSLAGLFVPDAVRVAGV